MARRYRGQARSGVLIAIYPSRRYFRGWHFGGRGGRHEESPRRGMGRRRRNMGAPSMGASMAALDCGRCSTRNSDSDLRNSQRSVTHLLAGETSFPSIRKNRIVTISRPVELESGSSGHADHNLPQQVRIRKNGLPQLVPVERAVWLVTRSVPGTPLSPRSQGSGLSNTSKAFLRAVRRSRLHPETFSDGDRCSSPVESRFVEPHTLVHEQHRHPLEPTR